MKTLAAILLIAGLACISRAASTINSTNSFAYGANIGWMDWRGDAGTNGVVIGEFICSGNIYAANVGWINLGNGSPSNGIRYANAATNDFGVNNLGTGELRGYAYGANIGWLVFTNNTASGPLLSSETPHFDLITGAFSGYAYSANCGWISLSNAFAYVKTDTVQPGADTNSNGLPDAWELQNFGFLGVNPNADPDGDGISNLQEYLAGTNPNDPNDRLRITAITANSLGSTSTVTWTSHAARLYQVQSRDDLVVGAWGTNSPPGLVSPDVGSLTTRTAPGTTTSNRFFRVQAIKPLSP